MKYTVIVSNGSGSIAVHVVGEDPLEAVVRALSDSTHYYQILGELFPVAVFAGHLHDLLGEAMTMRAEETDCIIDGLFSNLYGTWMRVVQ